MFLNAGRELIAHPTGTTISVRNMFYRYPVRKQTAIKDAEKTISKIKKLLHAYILVYSSIRFAFQTQGTAQKTSSLTYAPKTDCPSVVDAAMKLFGRACVNECV